MSQQNQTSKRANNMPTADEIAGMQWWNSMTEAERAQALEAAGWKSGGTWTPSAADAWATHKKRFGLDETRSVSPINPSKIP
ncbi:MAG: hypothetical protein WA642_11355 [Steroidobacteraceae bacterium]